MTSSKPLRDLGLSTGKKARLHRILYQHGLRNGTALLILKLNGKTDIPSDEAALSPLNATVEEAVRLGAYPPANWVPMS